VQLVMCFAKKKIVKLFFVMLLSRIDSTFLIEVVE
jgi:hypothetical protein